MFRKITLLIAVAIILSFFGLIGSPAYAASEVQCAIQWDGIKDSREKALVQAYLKSCGGSKKGAAARAKLATMIKSDVPSPPSQCDRLANDARSGTKGSLQRFVNVPCRSHPRYADAKRQLKTILVADERTPELVARQKLDGELSRWGLTFTDICGLSDDVLVKKANVRARLSEISNASAKGDSTALTLLGYYQLFEFYRPGDPLDKARGKLSMAIRTFSGGATAGNPRAMREYSFLLSASEFKNSDIARVMAKKSADMKCSAGLARYADSLNANDYPDSAAYNKVRSSLLNESFNAGYGEAAYSLIALLKPEDKVERERLVSEATRLGSSSGSVTRYADALGLANDPCAGGRMCKLKTDILNFANAGDAYASSYIARVMLNRSSGGRSNNMDALPYMRRAAEGGSVTSMLDLGRTYAVGELGGVDLTLASHWCWTATLLGSADGLSCVAMVSGESYYKGYFDSSHKKDDCAPYRVSIEHFPDAFRGNGDAGVRAEIAKLTLDRRNILKSRLPKIKYALAKAANTSASCAKDAEIWLGYMNRVIEPALP